MAIAFSSTARPSRPIDAVLFDVDGVLWDTRESYDRTICETLNHLLEALGQGQRAGRIREEDLRTFRRAGKLNSDFDLTYVLLTALLAGYDHLAEAARDTRGQGVAWAHALRGHASRLELDIICQWFDLVYWGTADFTRLIGGDLPPLPHLPGNWQLEKPFITTRHLEQLQAAGIEAFGIATGRSRLELQTVLDSSQLSRYIPLDAMCTRDTLSKPDPAVLAWCMQRMRRPTRGSHPHVSSLLYCGDTRDDLQLVLNYRDWEHREPATALWTGAVSVVTEDEFDFYLEAGAAACINHIGYLPAVVEELNQRTRSDT